MIYQLKFWFLIFIQNGTVLPIEYSLTTAICTCKFIILRLILVARTYLEIDKENEYELVKCLNVWNAYTIVKIDSDC